MTRVHLFIALTNKKTHLDVLTEDDQTAYVSMGRNEDISDSRSPRPHPLSTKGVSSAPGK